MNCPSSIGKLLKNYRKKHKMSGVELAKRLSVSKSYISRLEGGSRQIKQLETALRIAKKLHGVSVKDMTIAYLKDNA